MIGYSSINPLFFVFSFLMIGGIFGFITAPFATIGSAIGKVVSAGKTKAAATINAKNAAAQRAHEAKMAAIAQTQAMAQAESKAKSTQMMLMAGGGLAVLAFIFLRKKR